MGQRLAVVFEHEEQPIAAIYYHWSAFTVPALLIADDLIEAWDDCSDKEPWQTKLLNVIRFVRANRGGMDYYAEGREHEAAKAMYPNEIFPAEGYDRNHGLIALTPEGIDAIISAAEGEIIIDVDERTIFNTVVNAWESKEELMEAYDGYSEREIDKAPRINIDLSYMTFAELPYAMDVFLNYPDDYLFVHNDLIFEIIGW